MVQIGLVMTVYNEGKIIKRCLEAVKPIIDYYCIGVDEKTTDNTKEIILETLSDIEGVIFDSPWNGFADARNQVFAHVDKEVDWYLNMDADMLLKIDGFDKEKLDESKEIYLLDVYQHEFTWKLNWLMNSAYKWQWRGVLHEYLDCEDELEGNMGYCKTLSLQHLQDGGARKKTQEMFKNDADILLSALTQETDEDMVMRYTFYLANSFRDAQMGNEAVLFYRLRGAMGGWNEERYCSYLYAGKISNNAADYQKANSISPKRREAIYYLILLGCETNEIDILEDALARYEQVDGEWGDNSLLFTELCEVELEDWTTVAYGKVGQGQLALDRTAEFITNNPNLTPKQLERLELNKEFYTSLLNK